MKNPDNSSTFAPRVDPDDINKRVHPCGCVDRFLAFPPYGWRKFDRCDEHKESK